MDSATSSNRLREALFQSRSAFVGIALLSCVVNILYLTGSVFMLEVYDRVIPSRSIPTLVGLCILAVMLYGFQWLFDSVRGRILVRIGSSFDAALAPDVFSAILRHPLRFKAAGDGMLPLRDLEAIRSFIAGSGPSALCDLPWIPLYVLICWGFHPAIGVAVIIGAIVLLSIAFIAERAIQRPAQAASAAGSVRMAVAEGSRRNAEVVQALGMGTWLKVGWERRNAEFRAAQQEAADLALGLGGLSRVLRMVLQSGVLALGALLVIEQAASPGVIIAASILSARALAPVELAISQWKSLVAARQGWGRLTALLALDARTLPEIALPAPVASLKVQSVTAAPPGMDRLAVQDISFELQAGQGVGVIGPSGSGKSSIIRLLVGVWQPLRGKIRLDDASIDQWDPDELGRSIGYLPQDVELFSGSIAANIARFEPKATSEKVLAAAKAAGVHEMILAMPNGYHTNIGEGGTALSAGQRQRIALARALYGDPFLVVLDEPNSNLDSEGDEALASAMADVRRRGGIVVVVAHRPSALGNVDMILAVAGGRVAAVGPREQVLQRVLHAVPSAPRDEQPRGPVPMVGGSGGRRASA
jgi:PrtD family type I secretion system ABC transporter